MSVVKLTLSEVDAKNLLWCIKIAQERCQSCIREELCDAGDEDILSSLRTTIGYLEELDDRLRHGA